MAALKSIGGGEAAEAVELAGGTTISGKVDLGDGNDTLSGGGGR